MDVRVIDLRAIRGSAMRFEMMKPTGLKTSKGEVFGTAWSRYPTTARSRSLTLFGGRQT